MFGRTLAGALAILLMLVPAAAAQPQRNEQKAEREKTNKSEERSGPAPAPSSTINGATYPIATRGLAYFPGEVKVNVKGEENPVVSLGMAQAGITIIEFPGSDKFFAVHPPEGDLVRVEKSPSLKSDHHLVLRAGRDLANAPSPAASVAVQMTSGLNVLLWIHPVKQVTQQTHRCVFVYARDEIITARRRAGLAVNLGEREEREVEETQSAKAIAVAPPPRPVEEPQPNTPLPATPAPEPAVVEPKEKERNEDPKVSEALKRALKEAITEPKSFKKWSSATNGLSIATRGFDLDGGTRIALVAIKNVEDAPLRILPGHPDLVIETVNENGKVIHLSPVKKQHEETTAKSNLIAARGTIYYAIAFAPPILSTKQRLRITVGQRNAADGPAEAGLDIAGK